MSVTPNRGLPLMEPSQSQPEAVFNEAMEILDTGTTLEVEHSGSSPGVRDVVKMKFVGATVTEESGGVAVVTVDATSGGGGGGSPLTVNTLTDITKITLGGAAVSVDAGATGEAVVTIDTVSGGGGGGSGGNVTPDSHPESPMDADDEFEGTTLDTGGTRRAGAEAWSWVNQNGATAVLDAGSLVLTEHINSAADVNFIVQSITTSSTAWRYRSKLSELLAQQYNNGGIILRESSTGKLCNFGLVNYGGALGMWVEYASNETGTPTLGSEGALAGAWPFGITLPSSQIYLEVELASGTIHFRWSPTGFDGSFAEFYSAAQTTFFTTTPNQIGLGGYSFNASVAGVLFVDWFRQMA